MAELQGLGAQLSEAEKSGVEIVAISPDPNEQSQKVAEGLRLGYRFLADRDLAVARRFGLVHERGGPEGQDVSRPATIVLDRYGVTLHEKPVCGGRGHVVQAPDENASATVQIARHQATPDIAARLYREPYAGGKSGQRAFLAARTASFARSRAMALRVFFSIRRYASSTLRPVEVSRAPPRVLPPFAETTTGSLK